MKIGKEAKEVIKMLQMSDWEFKDDKGTYILMEKQEDTGLGHFIVLILTFWTFGIGNLIYHLISHKKKKVFK